MWERPGIWNFLSPVLLLMKLKKEERKKTIYQESGISTNLFYNIKELKKKAIKSQHYYT